MKKGSFIDIPNPFSMSPQASFLLSPEPFYCYPEHSLLTSRAFFLLSSRAQRGIFTNTLPLKLSRPATPIPGLYPLQRPVAHGFRTLLNTTIPGAHSPSPNGEQPTTIIALSRYSFLSVPVLQINLPHKYRADPKRISAFLYKKPLARKRY